MSSLIEKLDGLQHKFEEISMLITDPAVIADMQRYVKLNKEYSELSKIMNAQKEYSTTLSNIQEAKDILSNESDTELREMARMELEMLESKVPELEEKIKFLLIPVDPEDAKDVVMEIRGGTGGDEAAIFAGDLFKMYTRFCESKGWKVDVTDFSEGTIGGYKEIIFTVTGEKRVRYSEIRKRGSPRTARTRNRNPGSCTHLGSHCGCAPRSRRI